MAVSFVNQSQTGSATVTLPTSILAGDVIVLFGFRNTTTSPTLASGYTNVSSQSANGISFRSMYKFAVGTESGTTVTLTNANVVQCAVYRGVSRVGNATSTTNASSANTSIAGIGTFQDTDGSSWAVSYGGSLQTTSMGTPSATTIRGTTQTGTSCMALIGDSNTGVNSWGLRTSANGTNAAGGGGSLELIPIGAKIETLTDLFDQPTLNSKWLSTIGGSATITYDTTGATVTFPSSSTASTLGQVASKSFFDLTASYAFSQVLAFPSAATAANGELRLLIWDTPSNNYVRWVYESGTIFAQYMVLGTKSTPFSIAYNPAVHVYWRIRELSGSIYWDTSVDGLSWSNQTSVTTPITITALSMFLVGGCYQVETNPGTFKWNNVNILPSIIVTQVSTAMMMGV